MSQYFTVEFKCDNREQASALCQELQAKYDIALRKESGVRITSWLDGPMDSYNGVTFNALRAANEKRQKEWHKNGPSSLSYKGNELAGEVGEACNIIKKLDRERMGSVGSKATPGQLAEELADVIICTDLIAEEFDIDLGDAVSQKFNKTSAKYGLTTMFNGEAA